VREGLIDELALAIADRMKVDPTLDSRPFLLAATWLLAANWYRGYSLRTGQLPESVDEAVERISELVEGFVSAAAGGDKSN
jgi:hypothetical protein